MRLVHLADLHLGFRQYDRHNPAGINQREADIAKTLGLAIDKVIELQPQLVLIAGDVFHAVRPTNTTIVHAFNEFSRLVAQLPKAKIVMVAGNHDAPRTAETGCILNLFKTLGITVVEGKAQRVAFPELELSVLAVPEIPKRPPLVPNPDARYNILLLHGEIAGVIPRGAGAPHDEISQEELGAARWNYVALGHYHVYQSVAPNAYYSGSLDYTSSNSWGELKEERERNVCKGIIEQDLANGIHKFHPIAPSRPWVDLPPISGHDLSGASLNALIRSAVDSCEGGIDGKIVRLLVSDVPRHILKELDQKPLREFRRRALHFHLDTRRPEIIRTGAIGPRSPHRRMSVAESVREALLKRSLTDNIDRTGLIDLALKYLGEADELTGPAVEDARLESAST